MTCVMRRSRFRPAPAARRRRIGPDADAHVHAVGREARLQVEMLDLSEGEEAGIKGAVLEIKGQYAYGFLRPNRGSIAWCAFRRSTRRRGGTQLRVGVRLSCRERGDQHRNPRGGHPDGCVPRVRRRWAAREQDLVGRAPDAHSVRHRDRVAAGALAVQEQGDRHEAAQEQALPAGGWRSRPR
jgi:hypothetical protein